ncbi:MAG: replicative DNA helicase [bacterium]|nr:replicative DNA helicase [bacterium]
MASNKSFQEPQSIEAERAVLGAMILERDAISKIIESVNEHSFYLDAHRQIFSAIIKLYDSNIPVDLVTLSNELKIRNLLETIGGEVFLTDLLDSIVTTANVSHYAKIVKDMATLRDMIRVCNTVIQSGYQQSAEVDELLDLAEQSMFALREKRIEKGVTHIKPILTRTFELIEALAEKQQYITGIPTAFVELDKLTAGFQIADLVIIAGRPSMGKTSFCLNIAEHLGINENTAVGIFSLEMTKEQLVMRMLCSQARVSAQKMRGGFLKKSDWPKLTRAAGSLSEAPIFIDDTPGIPILEIRAKARRLKSQQDIKLIIIDYLQLVTGPYAENRQQEISSISRSLKGLAKELGIPIIAISQLSREVEKRPGHRPVLADLRESGAIEQDADLVAFIYREEHYHKTDENEGKAEVIVAKQRNGPIGKFELAFIKDYARFENLANAKMMPIEEASLEE